MPLVSVKVGLALAAKVAASPVTTPTDPKVSAELLVAVAAFDNTMVEVPPPLTIVVPPGMPVPVTLWPLKVATPAGTVTVVLRLVSPALTTIAVVPEVSEVVPPPVTTSRTG